MAHIILWVFSCDPLRNKRLARDLSFAKLPETVMKKTPRLLSEHAWGVQSPLKR